MVTRYQKTAEGWLDTTTGLEWGPTRDRQPWPTVHDLGDGWRVPSTDELFGTVDRSRYRPATELPDTQSDFYWSASTYALATLYAWIVDFYDGLVGAPNKTLTTYVRAVRGPHDPRTRVVEGEA